MVIIGIDLAWGERNRDDMCTIHFTRDGVYVEDFAYPHGDDQLIEELQQRLSPSSRALLTVDAPLVVPNRRGSRPVDRLTHRLFHHQHAGCHPANAERCSRPPRVLRALRRLGFRPGWDLTAHRRVVAEVYPHPALVRMLQLPRIIKYKRGPAASRHEEFRRLQRGLQTAIPLLFPMLELRDATPQLLVQPWSKQVEDLTDGLVCALIGLWHWRFRGRRSQILGNRRTGFILLPVI